MIFLEQYFRQCLHLHYCLVYGVFFLFMLQRLKDVFQTGNIVITVFVGFVWGTQKGSPVLWLFENVQMPMSSTMFALLAFYIASAAYKSFRARSVEATVLLLAATIVMLGQVSFGAVISNGYLPEIKDWILNVPNLAAKRGIALGVGLGGIATSLKILLGIERTYLGAGD